MAFNLGDMLKDVSNLDTGLRPDGREQIEYIDLKLIDSDPNNFYELSGVDELAANIELLGLQQPLRVRDNPDNPGHVMIVSGHRRRAAMQLLVDEGKQQFAQAPCIREAAASSAALQELRLIYANSDTRKMTSAELSKQAERVEALLYQLKEEGMDFPGRMRDHVAEACKVSKSKLARLKVIREKLDNSLKGYWESGELPESVAYALAQQPNDVQRAVVTYRCTQGGVKGLMEWHVESTAKNYTAFTRQACGRCGTSKCEHAGAMLDKIYANVNYYSYCEAYKCCDKCPKLDSCKSSCPKLKDKAERVKAEKKVEQRQEKAEQAAKAQARLDKVLHYWRRFGEARADSKASVEACMKAAKMIYSRMDDEEYRNMERGLGKISPQANLPYGYSFRLEDAEQLVAVADLLGCSLDYLFCRTDKPDFKAEAPASDFADDPACWHTGNPRASGDYLVKLALEDGYIRDILSYDRISGAWSWLSGELLKPDMASVAGWIKIPEDEEDDDEAQ